MYTYKHISSVGEGRKNRDIGGAGAGAGGVLSTFYVLIKICFAILHNVYSGNSV